MLYSLIVPCVAIAAPPDILVTIKPIHSLVSGLTQNITQPRLLIHGFQSPHDFNLTPTQRRLMAEVDFIIYTSPTIESFISGLHSSVNKQKLIDLSATPGLKKLDARSLHSHNHQHHEIDGHIWLSIDNAKHMLNYLAELFSDYDPDHKSQYMHNRQQLVDRLDKLKQKINEQLEPVRTMPFIIFHDAYQYFENEFGLESALFVTISPEHKPGIRQIRHLRKQIKQRNIRCIFYEPPQIPKIITTITQGADIRLLPLEPLGTDIPAGTDLYFQLLETTASTLHNCLQATNQGGL